MGYVKPSRCQKVTGIDKDINKIDRISSLSDDLLSHILSYLTTREAIMTSMVSKRWKLVWTKTPVLDFTFSFDKVKEKDNADCFVNRVLHMNEVSHLKKFSFAPLNLFDSAQYNKWITKLGERFIDEVDLCIGYYSPGNFKLPIELLVTFLVRVQPVILSLAGVSIKKISTSTFSRLKVLHLLHVRSGGASSMNSLLASCPALEELNISDSYWDTIHIESSSLKHLCLRNCILMPTLVIKAPYLQQLYLSSFMGLTNGAYALLGCLVKASINSETLLPLALLQAITGAQSLFFHCYWVDKSVQKAIQNNELCFDKLTHLKLNVFGDVHRFLPAMLSCSPNLVSLILHKMNTCHRERALSSHPEYVKWILPSDNPKCMLRLQEVEIKFDEEDIIECDDCLGIVRYLIRNAAVMKELKLLARAGDPEKEIRILKELLILPRASSTCQVMFVNIPTRFPC